MRHPWFTSFLARYTLLFFYVDLGYGDSALVSGDSALAPARSEGLWFFIECLTFHFVTGKISIGGGSTPKFYEPNQD